MQFNDLWDQPEEVFQVDGGSFTQNEVRRFCDTLSFISDKNGKKYRGGGYGGVNPFFTAASMLGNTKISPLTAKQTSFRKDVTIWLEASTTSAAYLITDDKRFIQTFENPHMMRLFEVCCERALHIKPMALISATEYLGLPTEKS